MSSLWDGTQLHAALGAAARTLEQNAEAVNALNVFPVPDGDTGTNMALTLNGALADVPPDPSAAVVAERVRHGTMMRGRGNSGIILAQVFRGMAQALAGHSSIGPAELAAALARGSAAAYKAVLKPVEGTMLTVLREASEAAHAAGRTAGASIGDVLEAATRGARDAVARSPELLKTLRDAGVVDAGGQGLLLMLEGMLRYARGDHDAAHEARPAAAPPARHAGFGYCTSFVLRGAALRLDEVRASMAALGDSPVLAGDETALKVHLHTARPGDALNAALRLGALDAVEIANMDLQHAARSAAPPAEAAQAPSTRVGVVAAASGAGFAAIFRSLHAGAVVDGGPTMNPSAQELLDAIGGLPQAEVLLLPNNANALLAARQAAELSDRRVAVLPARNMAQGVAALVGFNYQAGLEENLAAMEAAMRRVRTAEVTRAVRDATVGSLAVRAGQMIALVDGELAAAADDRVALLEELLERLQLAEAELVTVYYGGSAGREDAEALAETIAARYNEAGVEVHAGGQPLYDFIISAE